MWNRRLRRSGQCYFDDVGLAVAVGVGTAFDGGGEVGIGEDVIDAGGLGLRHQEAAAAAVTVELSGASLRDRAGGAASAAASSSEGRALAATEVESLLGQVFGRSRRRTPAVRE